MSAILKIFKDHLQRNNSVGKPLPQSPRRCLISKIAIQKIKRVSTDVSTPTATLFDALADV